MEFEEFVRRRMPEHMRFLTAMCADAALAEDVAQEVLLRAHARWSHIEQLDSPDAYVRRALVNEYFSWRRKWARLVPHAVLPQQQLTSPDHATQIAERSMLSAELAALPPRQRAVLVMRFYGGMSDAEIANTLGCRPVTVRGYASRALSTLRIELTATPTATSWSHDAH